MSTRTRKLSWWAILWGFVADVVAVETLRYGMWYGVRIWAAVQGANADHAARMLLPAMVVIMNVMSGVFLMLAGILTGHLARDTRYRNAVAVGVAKVGYNRAVAQRGYLGS